MIEQRWTIDKVFVIRPPEGGGWRWTYTLRGKPQARQDYATSREAAKAAERAWKAASR